MDAHSRSAPRVTIAATSTALVLATLLVAVPTPGYSTDGDAVESSAADSRWRVRGRLIGVLPNDDSDHVFLEAGGTATELTNGVSVDSQWVPELDVKYIDIDTTASLQVQRLGAGRRVNADIDPWVVGVGLGWRF